jgi:hypothetical protein
MSRAKFAMNRLSNLMGQQGIRCAKMVIMAFLFSLSPDGRPHGALIFEDLDKDHERFHESRGVVNPHDEQVTIRGTVDYIVLALKKGIVNKERKLTPFQPWPHRSDDRPTQAKGTCSESIVWIVPYWHRLKRTLEIPACSWSLHTRFGI